MAVIDLYTGQVVAPGKSPSTEKDGLDYSYLVTMDPGDTLTLCVANMNGLTLQNTAAGDVALEQSNYLCTIEGTVVIGGNPINGNVTNPNTVFAPIPGVTTTPDIINAMDITAIQQMRITAVNATEVSLTISAEAPENVGFIVSSSGASSSDVIVTRQRQDDTPTGKVEYTETLSVDPAGVETLLTTTTADGTPYVPVGTEEFNPLLACCFDVREVVPTFKVNGSVLPTLVAQDDGSLFWPEQSAPGVDVPNNFGIIIDCNPTHTEAITGIQWRFASTPGVPALLADNYDAGAYGVDATDRATKQRIFIRLFDTDGQTPTFAPTPSGQGAMSVEVSTASYTFAGMMALPAPDYTTERTVVRAASIGIVGVQTTGTEFVPNIRTWQPIVENQSTIDHYAYNDDPKTDSGGLTTYSTPCNASEFMFVPVGSGTPYNDQFVTCDQGSEYTNSIVSIAGGVNGGFEIVPIGDDPLNEIGDIGAYEYGFNTTDGLILKTAISYDTN